MTESRCYLAVFGDPHRPGHVAVEGGHFGVDAGWPRSIAPGDRVLLYCTGSYAAWPRCVPGIGVVEAVDHGARMAAYAYRPLRRPILLEELRLALEPEDRAKLANIRFNNHWLFEITAASYARAVEEPSSPDAARL